MPEWQPGVVKRNASKLVSTFRGASSRRRLVISFAKKHDLIYFRSVHPESEDAPVIRGTSVSPDQIDSNYCLGSHADYDMAFVERQASAMFEGYTTTKHRWYVLQIDLKRAQNLPFIFLGTRQQTKAYYARLLTTHREARYLSVISLSEKSPSFHATYAVISSPAELPLVERLFTDDITDMIATHKHPFAVEIQDDSVIVTTEANKASEQLLDELLHYGLWMAKTIDSRLI